VPLVLPLLPKAWVFSLWLRPVSAV